jgi:ADP-ribose pyrophosphatase YjhB (NUDIX family)
MQTRLNGIIVQSGVIPCRVRRGRLEIALVTASSGPHWTIPKGHIEPELSPQQSAAKESFEEVGLVGMVHPRCVCTYAYQKRGAMRHVRVYMMMVNQQLREWPERGRRQRRWMDAAQAAQCVSSERLRQCILRLNRWYSDQRAPMTLAA